MAVGLSRSPCRRVIWDDLAARASAFGELVERDRARIVKLGREGEARRALITAPPCVPVAPVTRIVRGVASVVAAEDIFGGWQGYAGVLLVVERFFCGEQRARYPEVRVESRC